jgi:hypothetical protein
MKLIKLTFMILFFLSVNYVYGSGTGPYNINTDITISADMCKGTITFKFLYLNDLDTDEHLEDYYIQIDGTTAFRGDWDVDDDDCSYTWLNESQDYCIRKINSDISWSNSGKKDNNDYVITITYKVPESKLGDEVTFRLVGFWDGDSTNDNLDVTKKITISNPDAPTGLSATTDECNKVILTWTQPSISCGEEMIGYDSHLSPTGCRGEFTIPGILGIWYCPVYVECCYTMQVSRGAGWFDVGKVDTWTDLDPSDGTEYEYSVRTKYTNTKGRDSYSSAQTATGKSVAKLSPPSGLSADANCNNEVVLSWSWSSANPEAFALYRNTSASGTYSLIDGTITGDKRQYTDAGLTGGQNYFYKIKTENECNEWGALSSAVQVTIPQIPNKPSYQSYSIASNKITITWDDLSGDEEKFVIKRVNVNDGTFTEFEVGAGIEEYVDDEALLCIPYVYQIKAANNCGESDSDDSEEVILSPDISDTFGSGALVASKGYYAERVQLDWEVSNNRNQIESFLIYRKVYGTDDSTLITTVPNTVSNYADEYASNSVIYIYSIKGRGLCNDANIYSNVISDIGFKIPTGVVSGKVTYQNGSATEGVTVTAESTEIPDFSSIALDGTNDYISIPDAGTSIQSAFTFQAYVRLDPTVPAGIINKGIQYNLNYMPGNLNFSVGGNNLSVPFTAPVDTFVQITAVFNGSKSYIYINGECADSSSAIGAPADNGNSFVLGANGINYLEGYIDEIRLWNIALDASKVKSNYSRYIAGNEDGLFGYYRLNENVDIDKIFDLSKTGDNYNGNHGLLKDGASYNSTEIPTIAQLWFRSITDEFGNYLITGIPYLSGGSNYKIVPMFAPHKFDPTDKMLYMGDGATIHNNIDFINVSTVTVTVSVFYNNTTFPVNEVRVLVDNRIQFDNNNRIVQTNENGTVDIEVPIGDHYLKFEKQFHNFNMPYFPGLDSADNIERYSFTEPRAVNILDTTRLRFVGKIVGGPIEAEKDLLSNVNPTKNNIGVASIELKTERGFDIDLDENLDPLDATPTTVSVTTDPVTGYFYFDLLPEKYIPANTLAIQTTGPNGGHIFNSDEDHTVIDMTMMFFDRVETDSIFVNNQFSHLDTTSLYNLRRDWIFRSVPEFSVYNEDGGKIISETEFEYSDDNGTEMVALAMEQGDSIFYNFGKPIFFFAQEYFIGLKAFEKYVNADDLEEDLVPVTDGRIIIYNDLSLEEKDIELELDENGEAGYTFRADFPNIADPFTKKLNITFKAGSTIVQWPSPPKLYDAYILGGRPTGNNFVTTGPAMVDFILRDPPGSNSSASLEVGHVNSSTFSYGISNTTEANIGGQINLGAKIQTVQGTPFFSVVNDTEAGSSIGGAVEASISLGGGYEEVYTTTTTEVISTSDDPDFNGRDGDVFVGHSTNIIYGLSKNMGIMPLDDVQDGKDTISIADTYAISIKDGLRLSPEFDTYFIYSQRIIEEEMIPHLIQLRNVIFDKDYYTNKCECNIDDPKYASKNDDSNIWGGEASDVLNDGPSYLYEPPIDTLIDSVRYFNNQIENWIAVLMQNEKQKTEALADENHQNISFGAGSVYESSIGSEYEESDNFTYEVSLGIEVSGQLDFDFNGVGFELTFGLKNTTNQTIESSSGTVESQSVGYTLSDQDAQNYLTVDVLKCQSGNGPVFKTRGGQTSCPYEGEQLSRYFEPGTHTLSFATMMIDGPQLSVDNPISPLIPETAPALFTINLQNVSQAEKDNWYIIGVDVGSNPDGAKIMMDGSTINDGMAVFVPYGETVVKTLEVWKGRSDVNDYEGLIIYLSSTCDDISQEVPISAFFASACSTVEFDFPGKGWVINVNDNDSMYVIASGYNLQHIGFEDFHFQYTPTGTSSWITTHIFTNDPSKADDDNTTFIDGSTSMEYFWDMSGLADRGYDIRLVSHCENGSVNYSEVLSGILDGKRPQVFGTPQPADGVLNVEDDILVQFNEPIEGGLLTQFNFDVKGTLNNYPIEHEAFLRYNGSSDYSSIPEGLSFNDKSFTIEFWVRPNSYSNSIIFSQGNDPELSIEIGLRLNGDTTTYFKIGNREFETKFQFSSVVPADAWQHMAYVYDYETGDVFIYQNDIGIGEWRGETIVVNNSGKIYLGKSSITGNGHFSGDIHELRIWSKIWSIGDIYANQYVPQSGNEIGLYGYWPIDEAFGDLAVDKAAFRHMEVFAPWIVDPGGKAWDFAGNKCLEFFAGYFTIIPEMDYTVEFWFKDTTPSDTVCLFSSQKGDGMEGEGWMEKALSIYATPDGKIWVASKGNVYEAASNNYFDEAWHHFALVVRRSGNVISYVDGIAQNERENTILGGISGGHMNIGVRKWDNIMGTGADRYYQGKLDEFRLWNLAKSRTQISMDMNSKLHGDEIGLMAYIPFEGYYDDGAGKLLLEESLENFVTDINAIDVVPCTIESFVIDVPNIKDARPVEDIAFDWIAAEDRIIVAPKVFLMPQLEKNIIEITVEGIQDKYGNRMASPVTWTAYVHRNQVRWEDERRSFTKEIYKSMDFVSSIKNTGGQQIGFTITNLPPWLTANPSSGNINPESTMDILFTISPALNIGEYNEDIILHTENGFDEKLPITVRVYKSPPDWEVDPAGFENSMNIVGRVKIEGVLSTDIFDKVAAFVNDSIRGVANVRYMKEFDSYLVFLTVYGNINKDQLEFRIWDASVGQILDEIIPDTIKFEVETILGSTRDPIIFEAIGLYRQYIALAQGWNWVSFNKLARNQNNLNSFFSSLEPSVNDQIKTHGGGFNNYDLTNGWLIGSIDSIDNRRMYQMKTSKNDTIVYSGMEIIPEDNPISLSVGWNHIGYLPDLAMDVNDALRLYVALEGEVIKSQFTFAMFDDRVGWLGNLDIMQPNLGYKFLVQNNGVLTYPNSTIFKGAKIPHYSSPPLGWESDLSQYQGNMSVVAQLDVKNVPEVTINDQMVLGAFINDENHGFVSPIVNSRIGYSPFFLNVSNSTNGQITEFRLFDGLTGSTFRIEENRPFVQDVVYGSTQNPLVLTLKTLTTGLGDFNHETFLTCYPNPFGGYINIEFSGRPNKVSIDVVNATGLLIQRIYDGYSVEGTNRAVWNGKNGKGGEVTSGIYYIRFISGDSVETVKISKTR